MKNLLYWAVLLLLLFLWQAHEDGKGMKQAVTEIWEGTSSSSGVQSSEDGEW